MREFIELRCKAREKRDKAIAQVRKDYAETLTRIAALEQDLLGRELSTYKRISASIERVIPQDRPFTTVDVMTALEALDPGRVWRKRSIDNHLSRLRERGLIRRLRRAHGTEPASYARMGVAVESGPFSGMTLVDALASLLRERPMNVIELTVALLERGYDTTMEPRAFRTAVGAALRNGGGRFRKSGEKWGCCNEPHWSSTRPR